MDKEPGFDFCLLFVMSNSSSASRRALGTTWRPWTFRKVKKIRIKATVCVSRCENHITLLARKWLVNISFSTRKMVVTFPLSFGG